MTRTCNWHSSLDWYIQCDDVKRTRMTLIISSTMFLMFIAVGIACINESV